MSEIRIKTMVVGMVATNCYLVYNNETKRAAIVDPGDSAGEIASKCTELGIKPEAIFLTHGHFDHMMAAGELKERYKIPVIACEKELDLLSDGRKNLVENYFRQPFSLKPDRTVKEGDVVEAAGFSWKVLETPGHTIGSCCYYIESEHVLFSGDTLFQLSYGRTDLPTGSGRSMVGSVTRLLRELPEDTQVFPGHMDSTTIGFEKTHNPLARFLTV